MLGSVFVDFSFDSFLAFSIFLFTFSISSLSGGLASSYPALPSYASVFFFSVFLVFLLIF